MDEKKKFDESIEYSGLFSMTLHNPIDEIVKGRNTKISIILPRSIPIDDYRMRLIPDNMQIVDTGFEEILYPQAWWGKNINIVFNNIRFNAEKIIESGHNGTILVNMPSSTLKYNFKISFHN